MPDLVYQKFVKRWEKVTELPVQSVGPLTPVYKIIARHLKVMPWPALLAVSIIFVVGVYFITGSTISFFVSVLQRGF